MRWTVIAALAAGCYDPSIQAGSACETACPGGLVCIANVCREPGSAPPDVAIAMGDGDGDGVDDVTDNCVAIANADQHDEDADAHGDVCDPCPHLPGTQADGDGDGVGDACDPQPAAANQVLVFFDPFTTMRSEWQHEDGVSYAGETLRIAGAETFTRLAVTTGSTRIVTAGTIASIGDDLPHQLSIEFGANAERSEFHYMQFFDNSDSSAITILEKANGTFIGLASTPYTGTLPTGAMAVRIDESVAAQRITLATTLGGAPQPELAADTTSAPKLRTGADITVYERNADIRLDYFLVIETKP